ncbi:putative endoglucanase type K [Bradysia coprophila]|uniref:putative endoglucanase type K n=1 Tax=Bradysia coprophila TaxID=38358 RepID=UPI00187D7AA5|nr:putative endoglucanase type K [Bradysia coprophila]
MKTNVVFRTYAVSKKWDCCKPSCASNEASVRNPVVSCSPDDIQIHNNSNVEDGCSGGDAFTCGFYQPWEENDYVSNGFATVRLPRKYDADLCCMCFKLKFTSGPVVGKEMIKQVINTGDTVTE